MRTLFCIVLVCLCSLAHAVNYTGVYSYSKGLNKANGLLYITQFNADSAFYMLQVVSGSPDYLTTELKGFLQIDHNKGSYYGKDSCLMEFLFESSVCTVNEVSHCHHEYSAHAKYKKTNSKIKKGVSFLPAFADKSGRVLSDSVFCYSIPHASGLCNFKVAKDEIVSITDECRGYYLIDMPSKKNDFIWIPKRQIKLIKNK